MKDEKPATCCTNIKCGFLRMQAVFILLICICASCAVFGSDPEETVCIAFENSDALYLDEKGNLLGDCAEYLKEIAWQEGWTLEYQSGTLQENMEALMEGNADILLTSSKIENFQEEVRYSALPGAYHMLGIYGCENSEICFNDYESMDQKILGVEADNLEKAEQCMKQNHFTGEIRQFDEIHSMNAAFQNKEIDLMLSDFSQGLSNVKLLSVLEYDPIYYCVRKDSDGLFSALSDGVSKAVIHKPQTIKESFCGVLSRTNSVAYTRDELEVMADTKKIVVGVYDDCLPLSGKDSEGQCKGIYIDILKELELLTGIQMEPYLISKEEYLYDYLDSGKVDYVMGTATLASLSDHEEDYVKTEDVIDYYSVAVSKNNFDLKATKTPVVALTTARRYLEDTIKNKYSDAVFLYVATAKECLSAVETGRADFTFINSWEYNYESKNPRFSGLIEWENTRVRTSAIMATGKKTGERTLSIIGKALGHISEDKKQEILSANINVEYKNYDATDTPYKVRAWMNSYGFLLIGVTLIFLIYFLMRRRNIRSLKKKNLELEKANSAKTEFLSRMSHDMRTPLNAIRNYSLFIQEAKTEDEMRSYGEKIITSEEYLETMINDILGLSRIEAGKMELNPQPYIYSEFEPGIRNVLEPRARSKGVHLIFVKPKMSSKYVMLDKLRMQQIFVNIVNNAIKFTPADGTVTVTTKLLEQTAERETIQIAVSDTGIGMSEAFLKNKLYQPFSQEHPGADTENTGTGLGMSIAKQLIEEMGGTIDCKSRQGVGTTFTVQIPAAVVADKVQETNTTEKPEYPHLKGRKILVCEDNEINREIIAQLLNKSGCIVQTAEDGKKGLDQFAASGVGEFDVILMDIRMPNMNGLEAAAAIRALDREDAKTIPIIATTANSYEEDIKEAMQAGMNAHIGKPIHPPLLYELLESCVKQEKKTKLESGE